MIKLLPYPQISGLYAYDGGWLPLCNGGEQPVRQCFVTFGVQCPIVDLPATQPQTFGKVPHGRQEQCSTDLVRPDMGRLFKGFHHEHHVLRWIKARKGA